MRFVTSAIVFCFLFQINAYPQERTDPTEFSSPSGMAPSIDWMFPGGALRIADAMEWWSILGAPNDTDQSKVSSAPLTKGFDPGPMGLPEPPSIPVLPQEDRAAETLTSIEHDIRLIYDDWELDKVTIEGYIPVGGAGPNQIKEEINVDDADRERVTLRYRAGTAAAGVFIDVLTEEFFEDSYEIYGLGLGFSGAMEFLYAEKHTWFVEYSFETIYNGGDIDVDVRDVLTGAPVGKTEGDIEYVEFIPRVGVGAEIKDTGFAPSAGLVASLIRGDIDYSFSNIHYDMDLEGENLALYGALEYRDKKLPLVARIEGLIGEIRGLTLGVGVYF
jgi:hypothetical protein